MAERALPTGTVTFLFSDMEGSTRLVRDLGPSVFTDLLEQHNEILRDAFRKHGGVERGTQGDSFLVMFPEAPAAVAAAAEAQRGLAAAAWPAEARVRVRMGVHTGVARLGGDDYVGLDVHRAARIGGVGHGGQVLLSDSTRALTAMDLPPGVTLRSLGSHVLRDLDHPEQLHQLVIDGLPADFPPLAVAYRHAGNLPNRLSSFIGRRRELEALERVLDEAPLITLTGPGGTGKTRLAMELAIRRASDFPDGAWLVRLEGVDDPGLVPDAIASAFELLDSPGTTPIERIRGYLASRSTLLLLDNFEHLLDAAPVVGELVGAEPGLRVLVTSRAPLRLRLEQEFPVSPLQPREAVELFVARGRHVAPDFGLTDENRPAVEEICRRLDGLPLGIELAASRIGLLPPAVIADQLTRRLDLPGVAPRDLPARQRTLTETVAWSYGLLDPPARRLLERLSVFAGGFRLVEIEAVAGPADELGAEPIDALAALVEQSLADPMAGPDVPRYRLLETIQRFARERLIASGGAPVTGERHAHAYLALAEEAASFMPGRHQVPWLDRLTTDHDNVRAAFGWASEEGDPELAHRLLSACWRFWQFRGHVTEGRTRAASILAMPGGEVTTLWRMRGLEAAGGLDWWAGDIPTADAHYEQALRVARAIDDRRGIADQLYNLIHTKFQIDPGRIEAMRAEAAALYRDLGDTLALARLEWTRAWEMAFAGRPDEARGISERAVVEFEAAEDDFYLALATTSIGGLALMEGDLPTAVRYGLRSVAANRAIGDLASITLFFRAATALFMMAGRTEAAATLLGAFEGHCRRYGIKPPLDPNQFLGLGGPTDDLVAVLDQPAVRAAYARGEAMSTDTVLEYLFDQAAELTSEPARP